MTKSVLIYLCLLVILSGCTGVAAGESLPVITGLPSPETPQTQTTVIATSTPPAPTPSIIFTPTPTPHPMAIAALRQRTFPGSDIVVEKELAQGANYYRYYVYYLSEGLKIYALLTVPKGTPPPGGWPAIVFNHGYIPPDEYRTTERYVAYVDQLARNKYVVFRIDYRGHDRSEGSPSGAYSNPGYTIDVLNAVAAIKRYPGVNPDKIGMWGHSMGGFLTLRTMVILPDVKAGVIWAGVVAPYEDMIYNWRRGSGTPTPTTTPLVGRGWRWSWVDTYGTPEENPVFWNSVSANAYLEDLSGPLQLHHGTDDAEVPSTFSEKLWQQVLEAGGTVELYLYPGDNHNISRSFTQAMERTIKFFDTYLK